MSIIEVWLGREWECEEMENNQKCREYSDAYCPIHPESSDDESWEDWYYGEYESIYCTNFPIRLISSLFRDEDGHEGWERYHADIAHDHSEHRHEDKKPEPRIPHIRPRRFRKICEHTECEWIEEEGSDWWYEHNRLLAMMIDERSEPDTSEEIEYEIYPSKYPRDEDRMCLEIEPEGDCKPDQHIRESSDCGVREDVGEEGLIIH